jgi:hypothetical protein
MFMGCAQGSKGKFDKCASNVQGTGDRCFCWRDFNRLNFKTKGGHYMAVASGIGLGGEMMKRARKNGNNVAYYVNDMHMHGSTNGAASATAFWKDACKRFKTCKAVPKFWIMNEILSERWPSVAYQKWVIGLTKGLKKRGLKPIISVPPRWSVSPVVGGSSFTEIGKYGILALELYVSGQMYRSSGFSAQYLNNYYGRPLSAYLRLGIPRSRIFMYEHYANSNSAIPYGRQGVSDADWIRTIKDRNKVIAKLKFGGVLAYAWWLNSMKQSPAVRDRFYMAHHKTRQALP